MPYRIKKGDEMNMTVDQLAAVPAKERNLDWENQFLKSLTESSVQVMTADPQYGPDGWPYLMVQTGETTEDSEPVQKILNWLSSRGLGMVVNPEKSSPDYIISYGMVWSFRETGRFFNPYEMKDGQQVVVEPGMPLLAGDAEVSYLPKDVRSILKEFLRDQGIFQPKILVMSTDRKHYDLAFSLESLGNPPEHEHRGIAEALGWFLPPHYSLVLISEKGLPSFFEL
jgi:hypothetical protein